MWKLPPGVCTVNFTLVHRGTEFGAVSVQTLLASAKSLVTGLEQIEDEVRALKKTSVPSGDRFIFVMKVRHGYSNPDLVINQCLPHSLSCKTPVGMSTP